MPTRIYKYPIPIEDAPTIHLPRGAEILHVADQHGVPCLWALVDTESPAIAFRFRVFGTGHPMPDDRAALEFVGTVLSGPLVWHVFLVVGTGGLPS